MGVVYRARDPKIGRVVALKTITVAAASPAEEEEYRQRFFREAQAAGKLSHPGLVTIYDMGEDETSMTPFIVMEFVAGQTLDSLAGQAGAERFPIDRSLDLVEQVAEALDYAHFQGIIHRDIKPANIIITQEGRAKVTDFGIAKLARTQFTQRGQVLGTPAYMSPEQLSGNAVDGRSDLFSLGIILYWLLTGDKPFSGDSATAVSFKVVYKDAIPVTELNPALSPDFDYVVGRVLAKDPEQRYQRGKEFADDLDDLRHQRRPRSLAEARLTESPERTLLSQPATPRPGPATVTPSLSSGNRLMDSVRQLFPDAPAALGRRLLDFLRQAPKAPAAVAVRRHSARLARQLSPRTYAVVLGLVLLVGFLVLLGEMGPTAALRVQCQHSFRSAELTIWADGDRIFRGELTGAVKERFGGLLKSVEGSFARTVEVPAGRRIIRVRVSAPDEGYEQAREIEGEFVENGQKSLHIGFSGRARNLYLSLRD